MLPSRAASGAVLLLLVAACGSGSSSTAQTSQSPTSAATGSAAATADPLPDAPLSQRLPVAGHPPGSGKPWFLAIGDSITFGYTVDPARAGKNSSWALQLQGLLAERGMGWDLYDTACPSETTATYFTRCPAAGLVPGLSDHSQHDLALEAVKTHSADLKLILIDLGSNDLLHALRSQQGAVQAYTALQAALRSIIVELRQAAPTVPIVLCDFYDPLENSLPATVGQLNLVNGALATLAQQLHLQLADFFGAINTLTPPDPDLGTYVDLAHHDIHPTVAGQTKLAAAALAAVLGR